MAELFYRLYGGVRATARGLGVDASTSSKWRNQGLVPEDYWPKAIAYAHEKGATWFVIALDQMRCRHCGRVATDG